MNPNGFIRPLPTRHARSTAAALATLIVAASAHAEVAVLTPTRDTSIYRDQPTNSNGAGNGLFAGNNRRGALARRALLAFDISSIPRTATITDASLSLYLSQESTGTGPLPVSIHKALVDWGEGTSLGSGAGDPATPGDATWTHRGFPTTMWATPGGDFVAQPSASTGVGFAGQWYTWASPAMTSDLRIWLANPAANFGWFILGDETAPRTAKRFDSRESGEPSQRPTLTVTFERCIADFNSINGLNLQDVFDYLAAWFAGCTLPGGLCIASANIDGQPGLAIADIFAFLNAWFAGC